MAVLTNLAVCLAIALAGGLGSAFYLMQSGSSLTTQRLGAWEVWKEAGRVESDPYTRAYVARSGRLPIGAGNARYYMASTDQTGGRLVAGCDYTIQGRGPKGLWWSLSAYDAQGELFKNAADRFAFNSTTVMRAPDGAYAVTLSREARSGNWLPVSGSSAVRLILRVYAPDIDESKPPRTAEEAGLPTIKRGPCR